MGLIYLLGKKGNVCDLKDTMDMLTYEWLLLERNKVTRLYFFTSTAAALVSAVLLFLIQKAAFDMSLHIAIMAFFTLGAFLYIYGIYSFSWESSFTRMSLKDSTYFLALVKTKLYVNLLFPTLVFLFSALLFYGLIGLSAVLPLFIAWVYVMLPGNLITLWLCSYWIKQVDWYEDQFEVVKQPPAHIMIVLVNMLCYLLIYYLAGLSGLGLLTVSLACMVFWFILKPLMIKSTVRNLKNIAYAIPKQPGH